MNKLVWVGVAAVVAVLLFVMWNTTGHTAPPGRQILTTSQTANPPPPTAAVVKAPFNASAYEVNYTFVFTVSSGDVAMSIRGWMVVGRGPPGNYTYGMVVLFGDVATFKSVTKGGAAYTMACFRGNCTLSQERWPFVGLIKGVNVTRAVKGQCKQLNYTGTLYEERGMLDPKAFSRVIEGLSGNYTAYICEVNGVMLSEDLTATASVRGEPLHVTIQMETVKAGPYRADVYNRILREVKPNK